MPDLHVPDSRSVRALFPRIHTVALGAAVALTAGAGMFLLTAFHVLARPDVPIGLLSWYLLGHSATWPGAFVGLAWGTAIGFFVGWVLGFVHNLTIDVWILVVRARADLSRTRRFLDQVR
jgi:hypothetical protein